jgi:Fic family protein
MEHGIRRLREGFPLSSRLLRELHGILLSRGRGAEKQPGEFRRSQNWIGGQRPGNAVFVPPPAEEVGASISQLERWLHDEPERTPPLIKAALSHVQFETIHPFLDGNGRVGRLLITLLLCVEGILSEPLLYVSLYLKEHRAEYYALLDRVRRDGDWEAWLDFFAQGVSESAAGAVETAQRLVKLARDDADRIRRMPRVAGTVLRVHQALQQRPLASANLIARLSGVSIPSVNSALATLANEGMVREISGRRRNRVFSYVEYLRVLSAGTEPL